LVVEVLGRAEIPLVPAIMRAPGLYTESDAGLSNPSLVIKEDLLETGAGCGGCGWSEMAAGAAASELPPSFFPAGSCRPFAAGAPPSDDLPPLSVGAADSGRFWT
jgi:hypothetical protein